MPFNVIPSFLALLIHFNILFSQILNVSTLTSEKKGTPPSMQTASAVEANVKDGTITPSFGFNPNEMRPNSNASVPLEQHKTYLDFENKDNSCSSSFTSGPKIYCP